MMGEEAGMPGGTSDSTANDAHLTPRAVALRSAAPHRGNGLRCNHPHDS